jgi:protein SCO1/2
MKKVLFRFLVLFTIIGVGATIVYLSIYSTPLLPVYNPSDLNPQVVDIKLRSTQKNHTIGDFKLTDQLNRTVTPKDFENKIYVSSFIFTTCKGICPAMTGNIKSVYTKFLEDDEIKFLSHSVTPEIDSVPVLKAYADKFGIENHDKWHFTIAPRKHIYELARMHYFAATDSGDGGPNDFVHTENLVLVDKEKRLRGFYDGTDFDEIDRLKNDIEVLKEEYE